MKKLLSCALILATLSSVASMCFAMNVGEFETPEITPVQTPELPQEGENLMLRRWDAVADLFENAATYEITPVQTPELPQEGETSALTRQNAGRIILVDSYEDIDIDEDFHTPEWHREQFENLLSSITPQDSLFGSATPELPLDEESTSIARQNAMGNLLESLQERTATPVLLQDEEVAALTRQNAMGNLFAGFQDRIVTPVLPQDEELLALTRQNAGPIVVDDNYDFTTYEMDLLNQ